MQEIWKDIEGYEGKYQISNLGRIKSLSRYISREIGSCITKEIIKSSYISHDGYPTVRLWKENKSQLFRVHRLVAAAFIPNPENKPEINHIDFNRANPLLENLEWVTPKENIQHSVNARRFQQETPVRCLNKEGKIISIYNSMGEARKLTGIFQSNIFYVISGKRKTAGGFIWQYHV